jgi:DNA-binding transcriptional MerR regulator
MDRSDGQQQVSRAVFLSPSEAARRLNVSAKALRLYERRGLLAPARTGAGWRAYGPDQMAKAAEISAMRGLGLSLAQIKHLISVTAEELGVALAGHQAMLEDQLAQLEAAVARVRAVRRDLAQGKPLAPGELIALVEETAVAPASLLSFVLPWPWNGETFELKELSPINYLIGPLGSGKGQFARRLVAHLPDACEIDIDRLDDGGAEAFERLDAQPELRERVGRTLGRLAERGVVGAEAAAWLEPSADRGAMPPAVRSLIVLLAWLERRDYRHLIVDLPERGLDEAMQVALMQDLRARAQAGWDLPTLFLIARSNAILDLGAVGPDEAVFLFPANHSPPSRITARPGSFGYEAVAMCLASPAVRARTEGVLVVRAPEALA